MPLNRPNPVLRDALADRPADRSSGGRRRRGLQKCPDPRWSPTSTRIAPGPLNGVPSPGEGVAGNACSREAAGGVVGEVDPRRVGLGSGSGVRGLYAPRPLPTWERQASSTLVALRIYCGRPGDREFPPPPQASASAWPQSSIGGAPNILSYRRSVWAYILSKSDLVDNPSKPRYG